MRVRVLHSLTVSLIIYTAVFYGMVEHIPIMRIVHQCGATLVFGFWMLSLWRSGRGWPVTPLDWPLVAVFVAWLISAAMAREPRVSLEYTWNYFILMLVFYVFVDLIRQGRMRWVLEGLFLFAGIMVIVSFGEMLAWYFGWPLVPGFVEGWPHIAGLSLPPNFHHVSLLLNNENTTAAYCVVLLPIAIGWASTTPIRQNRIGLGLLSGGLLLTALLTQSRGGFLAVAVTAGSAVGWAFSTWFAKKQLSRCSTLRRSPYIFVAGLILASVVATAAVTYITVRSENEIARSDLWLSTIRIFEDHLFFGVGPFQLGSTRYWYPNWVHSVGLDGFGHAHNLTFHLLAEGGTVAFTGVTWVVVRMLRLWWFHWHNVSPVKRLRLQAIALMVVGFTVHNAVDAFTTMRPWIVILAMVAIVVAPFHERVYLPTADRPKRAISMLTLAAAGLLIAMIAFVPIHAGLWKHQTAIRLFTENNFDGAIDAIRQAQQIDPSFDLYALEEAYILGLAAAEQPGQYREMAIIAHKDALDRNPVWDVGWNNLAGLYAQKGNFPAAVAAAQRATDRQPAMAEYQFQLGRYLLTNNQDELAQSAFLRALELHPGLAASDYWTDPNYPARTAVLTAAIRHFADDPETATDIAMYASDIELAGELYRNIEEFSSDEKKQTYEAVWGEQPCIPCFYIPSNQFLIQAESMLQNGNMTSGEFTIEEAARAALFRTNGQHVWANYILARIDSSKDENQINDMLFRAVPLPRNEQQRFSNVFYGIQSPLSTLPQAQAPVQSRYEYEPWLLLGKRLQNGQDWETALEIYELILERDPYNRTAQHQAAALASRIADRQHP